MAIHIVEQSSYLTNSQIITRSPSPKQYYTTYDPYVLVFSSLNLSLAILFLFEKLGEYYLISSVYKTRI